MKQTVSICTTCNYFKMLVREVAFFCSSSISSDFYKSTNQWIHPLLNHTTPSTVSQSR